MNYNTSSRLFEVYKEAYPDRKLKVKQGFIMYKDEYLASFDTSIEAIECLSKAGYRADSEERFN